jgi:carbon monoxide dehydrogenase subunit G
MKVTGDAVLHAPAADVWAALTDPAILVQAIPGCERLTATAPDTYDLTVTAGVGAITGTYTGSIALTEQQPPTALVLRASGAGSPGTVTTTVQVRLADNSNETRLRYDADATVGGMIAGVGQRMLAGVARRQADEFFTALDDLLLAQATAAEAPPAGPAASGASALTWERPTGPGQSAARMRPRPSSASFLQGIAVGAGVALAGVIVGGWIARRAR